VSLRSRLDWLDRMLGCGDQCRFCGKAHVRDLAQIVKAVYGGEALCDCPRCECHQQFADIFEYYALRDALANNTVGAPS